MNPSLKEIIMSNTLRNTLKWHVITRLHVHGLDNTPINRGQILNDLLREAKENVVVLPDYIAVINHELDWNDHTIENCG